MSADATGPLDDNSRDAIEAAFLGIVRAPGHGESAPHKPLALLAALGRAQRGESAAHFREYADQVSRLLRAFGGASWDDANVRDPLWRLQKDGIWQVSDVARIEMESSGGRPKISSLRIIDPLMSFTPPIAEALRVHADWIAALARAVLDAFFAPTLHEAIAGAAGVTLTPERVSRTTLVRDSRFRELVLGAYGGRCAICGYDGRLAGEPLGVEAAHVWWHCAGGASSLENGMCLCALHHVAFDQGAVTISTERRLVVSHHVGGGPAADAALRLLHGREITRPDSGEPVTEANLAWHRARRFRMPALSAS